MIPYRSPFTSPPMFATPRAPITTDKEEVHMIYARGKWYGEERKAVDGHMEHISKLDRPDVWKKIKDTFAENYKMGGGFQHELDSYFSRALSSTIHFLQTENVVDRIPSPKPVEKVKRD